MTDFRFSLAEMPEDQRRQVRKLNAIFSPLPITVTDTEMIIGYGDHTVEGEVWQDLYRALGPGAHCA
jgi:hypothetical protein